MILARKSIAAIDPVIQIRVKQSGTSTYEGYLECSKELSGWLGQSPFLWPLAHNLSPDLFHSLSQND